MKYDFEHVLDRHNMDSLAIDAPGTGGGFAPGGPLHGESIIPMWVADMNFIGAPCITEAICKRASHASFGYFRPKTEYFDSIVSWHKRRYGVDVAAENIGYENGVLGAFASALRAFTNEGDKVLLNGPTYIGFTHVLEDLKRPAEISMMKKDNQGIWRMDFNDMEERIITEGIKFAVFCSPHNPAGRVWEHSEIESFVQMCARNNVLIFSDEIWADIISPGFKHIPTHSVSEKAKEITISAYAPSKTFSLAGLIGSYHVVFNKELNEKLTHEGDITHYNSMNVLSEHALIAVYNEGEEWLDELNQVLADNIKFAAEFFSNHMSGVSFAVPQGTYMMYLDFTEYLKNSQFTDINELIKAGWDVGVIWQKGEPFGMKNTIRLNLALPKWQIEEAFARLTKAGIAGKKEDN